MFDSGGDDDWGVWCNDRRRVNRAIFVMWLTAMLNLCIVVVWAIVTWF